MKEKDGGFSSRCTVYYDVRLVKFTPSENQEERILASDLKAASEPSTKWSVSLSQRHGGKGSSAVPWAISCSRLAWGKEPEKLPNVVEGKGDQTACQPVNLSTCQPVNLSTCQPVNLPTCQPVNLSTCQPGSLFVCVCLFEHHLLSHLILFHHNRTRKRHGGSRGKPKRR